LYKIYLARFLNPTL